MWKKITILVVAILSATAFSQDFERPDFINPFTGEEYQEMAVGPTYYHSGFRNKYYYRYITLYNENVREEVISEYPRIKEFCHESGNRFAMWSIEKIFSRNITSGVGFNLLGIDINFGTGSSREVVFAFERWIIAQEGIEAIHTPLIQYTEKRGITYQQSYYPSTGRTVNIRLNREDFLVDYLEPMFIAHREITSQCE